ncbi:NAD(P)/FAD-dependent oxidoreductase [Brachybacterium sp. EF45031]|uniref:FAD/NAD(P)-binding oxidoreductase n=1 Tax=Brachybacterium sillae TaxID=2810536 RepID=UPI00217EEF7F|nr:FAD/NAD(P)-binding oxidoreductase [Brachybacterium sillae]MCS6711923.1 NAD(P)/FAD-dependent oxidoreductase [Brachybacterium sillae]
MNTLVIIATGTHTDPTEVTGMAEALAAGQAHDFYSLEGSAALAPVLKNLRRGNLVVHISEMPIKCPVAPMEFALLAQDYMRRRGRMFDVDITFVTPLDGAFTKPIASATLANLLAERGIRVVTDFQIAAVDGEAKQIRSYDDRVVDYDVLVTVPPNRGAQVVVDSGLGNDAGFVPVDRHTLRSLADPDIWVIGDATDAPTSKAGSVVHFEADALVPNLLADITGKPLPETFDGHANCFIESGRGQAMLLDFNYEQEPVTGVFPLPAVGPLKLLAPSGLNHLSKLAFEQIYSTMLIPGRTLPFPAHMSRAGKNIPRD